MTVALTSPPESHSETDSWDDLAPAEPVELPEASTQRPDTVDDGTAKATSGMCPVCGEPVYRQEGEKRRKKYHPECRPTGAQSTSDGTTVRRPRSGKAEAEADTAIIAFQQIVTRGAVMLSVVDRYDAFCVMVAMPQICENLRAVLIRYDTLRREFLAMQTGGSVIGLVLALSMMALPMMAHHGLLGKGRSAQLLYEMPFTMMRIAERLKEGSAALTKMMAEQLEAAREANRKMAEEAAKRTQHGGA